MIEIEKPTIEYIYLHKLVRSITFPDWDHIEITWKNGESTLLPLECDRGCEHPDPVMSMNPDGTCNFGSFVVSPCGVAAVQRAIENNLERLKNVTITMPDPNGMCRIPSVKMKKG